MNFLKRIKKERKDQWDEEDDLVEAPVEWAAEWAAVKWVAVVPEEIWAEVECPEEVVICLKEKWAVKRKPEEVIVSLQIAKASVLSSNYQLNSKF
jgi:hypothetical protein